MDKDMSNFMQNEPSYGRRETDHVCLFHHALEDKVFALEEYFKENNSKQDVYMEKLDKKIDMVDKKVDDLSRDMPGIVKRTFEEVIKDLIYGNIKRFFKIILTLILIAIAGAVVTVLIPELSCFLQEVINNLGG